MHDILIVTSRNVATSGGEFSLIKNRADALKNGWGIESDVAALCNVRLGVSEGGEAFGPGVYVRRDFMNPMQLLSGYEELISTAEKKVLSGSYKAIILSGVGLFRYVDRMKRAAEASGAFVCADVHGYYGDGSLLARDEPLFLGSFHRAAAFVERYEQRKYLRKFDRIFCVSRAYRSFLCRECGCKEGQFYIVPCATGAKPSFGRAEELKYREDYRRKYGVEDDEWLLVYSGGASSWQCLPQTAELYREILKRRGAKLLVLSGDVTSARAAIGDCDDVEFDSFKPSDLPSVFCAADFFVMLREDVPTNHFAYPNKFLEYVAAHRPVITTPYVYDIAEEIDRHGVGLLYNGDVDDLVLKMDNAVCDRDSCDRLVQKVSFANSLIPFARDLGSVGSSC